MCVVARNSGGATQYYSIDEHIAKPFNPFFFGGGKIAKLTNVSILVYERKESNKSTKE